MGENKSLLKIKDQPIIKFIFSKLESIFENIIIITNEPDHYSFIDCKKFKDFYPGFGPISGIHSGLINSATERNFILTCDIPMFNRDIIDHLVNHYTGKEIVLPSLNGKQEPLFGIYNKTLSEKFENILVEYSKANSDIKNKKFKLFKILESLSPEIIIVDSCPFVDKNTFYNMNTKEDFDYITTLLNDEKYEN